MNKFFTKIAAATVGFAMAIGVGMAVAKNANPIYAENATMAAGSNSSSATVNNKAAIKCGSGSKAGVMTITLANAGATSLSVYVGGWNNDTGRTINVSVTSGVTISPTSFDVANESGFSGTGSAFTVDDETIHLQSFTLTNATANTVVTFTAKNASKNRYVVWNPTYSTGGGQQNPTNLTNPAPQYDDLDKAVSWTSDTNATKYQVKIDDGSYSDIETSTYDARNLSVGEEHTVYIKAVGDGTNYLDAEASVKFTPTTYEVHRKFKVDTKTSVIETGDAITGATASYSQTANNLYQITNENSMTLSLTGLTKKVTINKLVLSMHSNSKSGSGSISIKTDSDDASFIAGTSNTVGAPFTQFGDNTAFSATEFVDVTWTGLNYIAKSSIEIKIYGTDNSLYCQSFLVFFSEQENNDYVAELTVSPSTWTGYDTDLLQIEDFTVSVTTGGVAGSAVDYTFLGIGYMDGENFVARDANFIYGYPTTADTRLAWKANYPTTVGGDTYLYAYVTLNVTADTLDTIVISENLLKTSYFTTDSWEAYGLQAKGVYTSGTELAVSAYVEYSFYRDSEMTEQVATPNDLGIGANQTVYIKGTYNSVSNATGYAQTVSVSIEPGTRIDDPLTPDQAIAIGSQYGNNGETEKQYYIRGTVISITTNQLDQEGNSKYATFDLEESSEQFKFTAYKIKPNEGCTNYTDLKVGAIVLLQCRIKNYLNTTIENGSLGELLEISYTAEALTGVALNKASMIMEAGEQKTLTPSAVPVAAELGTVTWSSSDELVATVDTNGKVSAVATGSAVITASAGGFEATCNVLVANTRAINLTIDETTSASDDALVWDYPNEFKVEDAKNGGTKVTNYYPGTSGQSYTVTRFYAKNVVTVTPDKKTNVLQAVFTTSYDASANKLAASTFTNATAVIDSKSVVVTAVDPTKPFSIAVTDKCDFNEIKVYYQDAGAKELVERTTTSTQLSYRYQDNGDNTFTYTDISIRFGAVISKANWEALDAIGTGIEGFGVMITTDKVISGEDRISNYVDPYLAEPAASNPDLTDNIADYFMPRTGEPSMDVPPSEGDNYVWNLFMSVSYEDRNVSYVAAAYVKVNGEYVFLEQECYSVVSLAKDYLENRNCTDATADGSLDYLSKQVAQNN